MAAVEHGAKLPVLNMPDVLRDPVAALAGREVPVTLLQQRATSFLQRCHVCLAPESARHRGTPPAVSQPTLLFHASDRQPPCGTAILRGHVYWASRSAALYAQRHAYEYAFIDTSRPVAELVQAPAKRPAMPVHFPFAVVVAQFSKSALLLALAIEGPWKQLMYLDDDAGFVSPMLAPSLPAIFGGVSTHLCSGKGVSIDELATSRSLDGTTAVIKSLYYEKMHPLEPQVVSARVPRLMLAAAQPNVWDGSLKWCSACAARARHWPLRGWVDDCPVNSGMVLVGTCPAAQHLLAAWSALSPANGECAAMINWRPSINASVKEAEDIARTPTDLRQEGHPLRVCPCSVRCKDQHALNSLLENEFLGSAIVVNDALVNGKLFADGSTPKYIQHVWCGSGHESSKEVCSKTRNATAFSWLGEAAEDPGLDELVPRAISWKEALLLVRARHDRRRVVML